MWRTAVAGEGYVGRRALFDTTVGGKPRPIATCDAPSGVMSALAGDPLRPAGVETEHVPGNVFHRNQISRPSI
jgi:hypothetical protein